MSDWKESKTIVGEEEGSERRVVAYARRRPVGLHVHDLKGGKVRGPPVGDSRYKTVDRLMEHLYGASLARR